MPLSIYFSVSFDQMGLENLLGMKSYIHLRFEPNPMVLEKLAWHKSYIHLQFEANPMVREKLT